jgi:hypothetical protein
MTIDAQPSQPASRTALLPLPDAEILSFLYLEARLADEGRYSEWEALWVDDDDTVGMPPAHPGCRCSVHAVPDVYD